MNRSTFIRIALVTTLLAVLATACTSRLRLDLFVVEGDNRTKVKVEKTEFMIGTVLGDPLSRDKVEPGDGNMLVLITGSRGQTLDKKAHDIVSWDRYTRYRVFVQLETTIEVGRTKLKDRSLVQLMGRYELDAVSKLYRPVQGDVIIDSIVGNKLFGTIDAQYKNVNDEAIIFEGKFKAKISN